MILSKTFVYLSALYQTRHDLNLTNVRMSSNLSICTDFRLFRKSNLLIVILSLTCIFICCASAGDSYEESKPGNDKPKSEVFRLRSKILLLQFFWRTIKLTRWSANSICGPIWGSLTAEDHLWSILGIICGCSSFAVLYTTRTDFVSFFALFKKKEFTYYTGLFS